MTSKITKIKYSFRKNKKLLMKKANPTDINATKTIKIIFMGLFIIVALDCLFLSFAKCHKNSANI